MTPAPSMAFQLDSSGWQPIETAPKDSNVLLYCPHLAASNPERIELGCAVTTNGLDHGWSYHSWATHWMPLPAPPLSPEGKAICEEPVS